MPKKSLHLKIDPSSSPGVLKHTVNFDQFRWLVRRDAQEHLRLASEELGARHVRAVGIFDDEMRVLGIDPKNFSLPGKRGEVRLNFQVVDYVIDSLLELGISPMITTTFIASARPKTTMIGVTLSSKRFDISQRATGEK